MEIEFGAALLRLKERLQMHNDKDVAAVLQLSPTAFNSRKVRGSFPVDKLRAVAASRPELGIDADYVLTGVQSAAAPPGRRPPASDEAMQLLEWAAVFAGRARNRGIDLDSKAARDLARLAIGADRAVMGDEAIDRMTDSYCRGRGA